MSDARFRKILLLIVLGALAFRVGYVLLAKFDEPTKGDQVYYNITANQVARGLGFTDPRDGSEIAQHPPLTTLVLVPASWVNEQFDEDGEHLLAQRLTMAVIGAGVVVLIALVGRRVGGNRVGLISAGIAALWPALWMNDGLVMSETLAAGGVALAILLAYRFGRDPTWLNAEWLGGAIGLSMLARAELGLLLPCMVLPVAFFVGAFSVWRRLALVVVSGLAALVVLSPWLIFNLTRFNDPSLLSTNDGLTLCGANNQDSWYGQGTGLWVIRINERTGRAVDGNSGACEVPQGTLTEAGIDASQLSNNLRADAFDFIGDHLDRLPVVLAVRIARVWSLYDPSYMAALNTGEGREEWASWIGTMAFWLAIPFTVAGVVVLRNRKVPVTPLVAQFVVVTLTATLIYGLVRFRVPAEISIVVLSAVAVDRLIDRLRPGTDEAKAVQSPDANAGEDPAALQPEPLS